MPAAPLCMRNDVVQLSPKQDDGGMVRWLRWVRYRGTRVCPLVVPFWPPSEPLKMKNEAVFVFSLDLLLCSRLRPFPSPTAAVSRPTLDVNRKHTEKSVGGGGAKPSLQS